MKHSSERNLAGKSCSDVYYVVQVQGGFDFSVCGRKCDVSVFKWNTRVLWYSQLVSWLFFNFLASRNS